jgi:autotransporter strand-loop-strand O-heptosyltransferase
MSKILVELLSNSMGDTIGAMPCINKFCEINPNVVVRINPFFEKFFKNSFPNIVFYKEGMDCSKHLKIDYDFTKPLQSGFAEQLGFMDWEYIRPKIDVNIGKRPIKNKYVTISIHSTSQLKYWNHPNGESEQPNSTYWDELCGLIRKSGYTPVVVERDEMFGVPPYRNGLPKKANKKFGLSLEETINYIYHSEFFIGLSSGLSWLAHSMGKPVVMISNFTEDWHEFDLSTSDYKRITNKNVCHGCWNLVGKGITFNHQDWYWCPKHKGTDRQFECHTSITPEMVFDKIKFWLK